MRARAGAASAFQLWANASYPSEGWEEDRTGPCRPTHTHLNSLSRSLKASRRSSSSTIT